jgi:hypothetical protein
MGVQVLEAAYAGQAEAMQGISNLESYYQTHNSGFYGAHPDQVKQAVGALQQVYSDSVFVDQKVNWDTHPSNVGHIDSPGCFRCHDGKHLDSNQQAIRLECNLCHSIPVVAGAEDFVTGIEISRGPEPESHRSPNWISLHNQSIDSSCSACHTMADAGGTSNTSFCSNSACHGSVFSYAGFDAPALREILRAQIPTPAPTPVTAPLGGSPTYEGNIAALLEPTCGVCHNATTLAGGMDLTTYGGLMKGGKQGPAVVPGDSAGSLLIQVQSSQHFANLAAADLELVKQWIDGGAPEK